MSTQSATIESKKDYPNTARGKYDYWDTELTAAKKRLKKWHKEANKVVSRYLDEKRDINKTMFRLNLLNSNVTTILSMLYGNLPRPDVSRRDHTGNDDVARVAAETMERLLRLDIQSNGQTYDAVLHSVLSDRLLGGLGTARVRYDFEEAEIDVAQLATVDGMPVEQMELQTEIVNEDAPVEYVYWEDILWGWGRNFAELPWIAFRAYMTKDEVAERFGEDVIKSMEFKQQQVINDGDGEKDPSLNSAWQKAEIWEIWCKDEKRVYWISPGHPKVLDAKDDPLRLRDFYPCPPFLLANQTTSLYKPTSDYHLAEDLYNQIDTLQTRISILTDAVKVVGVYDSSSTGVKRMLSEGVENDLIPVDNWAMFAEKGGLKGQVDWLPIEAVVNALDRLRALRDETIGLLQQVTGMADIMRGDLGNAYEGVGQTQIKARFGSARMQALQEQFASFVSNLFQLKAEVIAKHFEPETILKKSGMQFSYDQQLLPQAVQMMQSDEFPLRVVIRPETMAQMDYAQLQAERASYLTGLSGFLQAATPLAEMDKRALPFLLQMLKWAMAGFKGAKDIEGVMDQAIDAMSQAPETTEAEEKPDPEQIRAQLQLQLEDKRQQAKQMEIQMNHQAQMAMREADRQADIETKRMESEFRKQEMQIETMLELQKISGKMEADVRTELLTSQINAQQNSAAGQVEIEKQIIKGRQEIEKIKVEQEGEMAIEMAKKGVDASMKREELAEKRMEAAAQSSESSDEKKV